MKKLLARLQEVLAIEKVTAGDSVNKTVRLSSDLVADIRITIRREVSATEAAELRRFAEELLKKARWRGGSCEESSTVRERFGRGTRQCRNRAAWAMVDTGLSGLQYARFVCTAHAKQLSSEGRSVVRLSKKAFEDARRKAKDGA